MRILKVMRWLLEYFHFEKAVTSVGCIDTPLAKFAAERRLPLLTMRYASTQPLDDVNVSHKYRSSRKLIVRIFSFIILFFSAQCVHAADEVVAPRVHVIYDDPVLAGYAQEVAREAEAALDILVQYFGEPKDSIAITLNNNSDIFNAFGSPLPRPKVSARALFPNDGVLGFGAENELFLLILHELTHTTQLTYSEGSSGLSLGIVGEGTAQVPPMWFLEGIAVWMESEYTEGGRRNDALTIGLLDTLVLSEDFPTLTEVSLSSFGAWPGGNARYLLGVSFLQYLIDKYSIDAVMAVLREYNAGFVLATFAEAWQNVTGADLFTEWETWRENLRAEAERRTKDLLEQNLLTASGWYTSSPSLSPDGKRLAWVSQPSKIVVADVEENELKNERTVIDRRAPDTLEWLDDNTLVYSRIVRRPGTEYLELFLLDVTTGRETQLTEGARALFPNVMPDGCIVFVRDLPFERSSLHNFCDGMIATYWQAPENTHIVGLDVNSEGQVLISLWRDGETDIARLENNELSFLTDDSFQDLHPSWKNIGEVLFSSNRDGRYEIYALKLESRESELPLTKITDSPGAALQVTSKSEDVFYVTLGANGYNLAVTKQQGELIMPSESSSVSEPVASSRSKIGETLNEVGVNRIEAQPLEQTQPTFAVRRYSPWGSLSPYGWLPTTFGVSLSPLGVSLGASLYGLDDTLVHGYSLNASYSSFLRGHLGGASLYAVYEHNANTVYTQLLPPYPSSLTILLGVWEHSPHLLGTTETALGFQTTFRTTLPLDRWVFRATLQGGLVHLQSNGKMQPEFAFGVSLSQQNSDDWGYRTRGPRFSITGVESATPKDPSYGLWADASYYQSLRVFDVSGTLELAVRAGYRPSRPIPISLNDWVVIGTAGYRFNIPVEWRIGDGRYSFERITLEPRVRPYFDGNFGVGVDVTISADTILGYGAPTTFGVTFGYAQNQLWSSLGLRLPL
jgi:hypothetical protein